MTPNVYTRSDGCIRLGNHVTCDGFAAGVPIRIQTTAHQDHLKDFERSKGSQDRIVMSEATLDLLAAEFGENLRNRKSQIVCLPDDGTFHHIEGVDIALFSSGHTLGSVMPVVMESGLSYAYTSDFNWPLSVYPSNVHKLVVSAAYGSPEDIRSYNQQTVAERFVHTVQNALTSGAVLIKGDKGRPQHVVPMLTSMHNTPVLLGDSVARTIDVYARHSGHRLSNVNVHNINSVRGREILRNSGSFIGCVDLKDRIPELGNVDITKILLSAFMVPKEDPMLVHRNGSIRIALTDHADFLGTIELIKAIAPDFVIADGTRGGNADALAAFVNEQLNIRASSDTTPIGLAWGD